MTNIFNKVTQSVSEAFKGPRTKDFEFEKMAQEYQVCKERMLSLKNIIDRYPEKLEGYKLTLDQIVTSFGTIFDKEQGNYFQFMSNVSSAHKALHDKLLNMCTKLEHLKGSMSRWMEHCSSVDGKLSLREEKRKAFDHYDEKMAELLDERNKLINKGKIPGEKDDEKYVRNVKKYQSSAGEYVDAANDAFKHICYFLDSRYDNILVSVVELIEIEAAFYNEASFILNYFKNIRNTHANIKQSFKPIKREYDASNFIRGKSLLNIDVEKMIKDSESISGVIQGKPEYSQKSSNEINKTKTDNQNNHNMAYNPFNSQNPQKTNNFLDPYSTNPKNNNFGNNTYNTYGNNNFNNNQNNYNNKIDNSIPDPFLNESVNKGNFNPYESQNSFFKINDNPMNPYTPGNTMPDNPFDKPNV